MPGLGAPLPAACGPAALSGAGSGLVGSTDLPARARIAHYGRATVARAPDSGLPSTSRRSARNQHRHPFFDVGQHESGIQRPVGPGRMLDGVVESALNIEVIYQSCKLYGPSKACSRALPLLSELPKEDRGGGDASRARAFFDAGIAVPAEAHVVLLA